MIHTELCAGNILICQALCVPCHSACLQSRSW